MEDAPQLARNSWKTAARSLVHKNRCSHNRWTLTTVSFWASHMTRARQKAEFISARISQEADRLVEEFRDAQLIRPTRSAAIDALIKIGVPAWRRGEGQKAAA